MHYTNFVFKISVTTFLQVVGDAVAVCCYMVDALVSL